MATLQVLNLVFLGDRDWWRFLMVAVFLLGAILVPRSEASEFTTAGVRLRKWGLRWRHVPQSEIAEIREKDRWEDGVRLVLRSGKVIVVRHVPRKQLPVVQRILNR